MLFFRKHILPWTARAAFESDAAFQSFLKRKYKLFTDLRMVFIVIAAVPLILGYVMDVRPLMLVTIIPLLIVLAASVAMDQIEKQHSETEDG